MMNNLKNFDKILINIAYHLIKNLIFANELKFIIKIATIKCIMKI